MTTHQEALLPCPFCGGRAEIIHIEEGENAGGSCVCCTRCMASGNVEFGFKENFVNNWNRRHAMVAPPAVPADERVVEALREAAERFDEIRVILIEHLEEPERTAFWKAVNGREFCWHALSATEGRKNG